MPCKKQFERDERNAAAGLPSAVDAERERLTLAIQDRVAEAVGSGCVVRFAAYRIDARGMPIDNLDEIAVPGLVQFVQEHDPFWGRGADYRSSILSDPTWLEVAVIANEMIGVTGDRQHRFLEGVTRLRMENEVDVVELDMGS